MFEYYFQGHDDASPRLGEVVKKSIGEYLNMPDILFVVDNDEVSTYFPWDAAERVLGHLTTRTYGQLEQELQASGLVNHDIELTDCDHSPVHEYSPLAVQIGSLMLDDDEVQFIYDDRLNRLMHNDRLETKFY